MEIAGGARASMTNELTDLLDTTDLKALGQKEKLEVEGGEETEGQVKKSETKEATSVSSSGQYNQPSIWAKSMSKKDFRGYSKRKRSRIIN